VDVDVDLVIDVVAVVVVCLDEVTPRGGQTGGRSPTPSSLVQAHDYDYDYV
jgi:hypothetical protein